VERVMEEVARSAEPPLHFWLFLYGNIRDL